MTPRTPHGQLYGWVALPKRFGAVNFLQTVRRRMAKGDAYAIVATGRVLAPRWAVELEGFRAIERSTARRFRRRRLLRFSARGMLAPAVQT